MDVKQAIATARKQFSEVFADEDKQPTLEEVWFDDRNSSWNITFGLRRFGQKPSGVLPGLLGPVIEYKTVTLTDLDGKILSIKIRQPELG